MRRRDQLGPGSRSSPISRPRRRPACRAIRTCTSARKARRATPVTPLQTPKFAVATFAHDAKTAFALTGKHSTVTCAGCHKPETGVFPAGAGTAVRLKGVGKECRACHADVHLGQVAERCESCHVTTSFKVASLQAPEPEPIPLDILRGQPCQGHLRRVPQAVHRKIPEGQRHRRAVRGGFQVRCVPYRRSPGLARPQVCELSQAMTKRTSFIIAIAAATLILSVGGALAQFDTPNRAFHNQTTFRLEGRHQAVPCESCHLNGQFRGTPSTCFDCHWVRRKDDRYQTRLGAAVRTVPSTHGVDGCSMESQYAGWRGAESRPPVDRLRVVPPERQLPGLVGQLRQLSPEGLRGRGVTKSPGGRLPGHMRRLPSPERFDVAKHRDGGLQPQQRLRPRRRARHTGLHVVSQ